MIFKGELKMTNENQANQANNQAANQANVQANSEAKTVVNGKVVSLAEAYQAEQQAAQQAQQTGVQAHHSNHSEAVQAGQTAQNAAQQQPTNLNIRQANVQSGQSHMGAAQFGYEGKDETTEFSQVQADTSEAAKQNAKVKTTKKAD